MRRAEWNASPASLDANPPRSSSRRENGALPRSSSASTRTRFFTIPRAQCTGILPYKGRSRGAFQLRRGGDCAAPRNLPIALMALLGGLASCSVARLGVARPPACPARRPGLRPDAASGGAYGLAPGSPVGWATRPRGFFLFGVARAPRPPSSRFCFSLAWRGALVFFRDRAVREGALGRGLLGGRAAPGRRSAPRPTLAFVAERMAGRSMDSRAARTDLMCREKRSGFAPSNFLARSHRFGFTGPLFPPSSVGVVLGARCCYNPPRTCIPSARAFSAAFCRLRRQKAASFAPPCNPWV